MIRFNTVFVRLSIVCLLLAGVVCNGFAANTKKSEAVVNNLVTITDDWDYTVVSATPFGDEGVVNIVNTDHAVLILSAVKPSAAIKLLADHVKINGEKAVNGTNCQVKIYNRGCIILPYGNATKPLTVYSGQNFEGESCNNFGLENSGGYMNTLTAAKLNNKIRSFKLKRGYMVTFSTLASGRGYSRCFIAADADLEFSTLPAVLDQKISSYRVFKWYDAGKKQLANDLTTATLNALNVNSSYTWSQGHDMTPDYECVPNHIYEDYPSSAAIGQATWSPHCKNNNEPRNGSDDHPQDLATILNNWENMMRTGLRLCSPASWDGSDYWNATGFLADFMDSIDARGWRCDIIDLHCYWPESNFGNIANWNNKYKRPIWISEWCWGASWNSNGAFASGVTENDVKSALQRICTDLNNSNYVERYYYWNGERDPSRLYKDGALTPAGEYYSSMTSPMAYNGKYNFVPTTPRQYAPSKFNKTIANGKTTLTWHDANGEYNQLMEIQKKDENGVWVNFATIEQKETAADYTYVVDSADEDVAYRLHVVDINNKEYFSSELLETGDVVMVGDKTMYAGGNQIVNGDFEYGFEGWTNGKGTSLSTPLFQAVNDGGYGGGAYLQAHGSKGADDEASLRTVFDVEQDKDYFFCNAISNGGTYQKVSLNTDGKSETSVVATMTNSSSLSYQKTIFNTGTYQKLMLSYRWLGAKVGLDKVELRKLFDTREEADADGLAWARKKAEAQVAYYTQYADLNQMLKAEMASATTAASAEKSVETHRKAIRAMAVADSIGSVLEAIETIKCVNYDQMIALHASLASAETLTEIVKTVDELKDMLNLYLNFVDATVQPTTPSFAGSSNGWETKAGTYTGGDQRTNTVMGKTCWNAWWNITAAENPNATMEIRQAVNGLEAGIYAVECKGTTQHFCLSDQHGYLKVGDNMAKTPSLTFDYMDLPVGNVWETLTTTPLYVGDEGEATIGFVGSKKGATDGFYREFGNANAAYDNRAGWWCATDFVLKYHPMFQKTVEPNYWGVICLPYKMQPGEGVKIYQIAGLTSDYAKVCLEEIEETQAGMPCVFFSEVTNAVFHEYGEGVTSAVNGSGNLRGFLKNVPVEYRAQTNSFVLMNGTWQKVGTGRPVIGRYTGVIRPFTGSGAGNGFTLYDNWDGITLPIEGITEDDKAQNELLLGIGTPVMRTMSLDGIYTIDGRYVSTEASSLKPGLYIKVAEGRVFKTIVK